MRVLVADDDPGVVRLLTAALDRERHVVDIAATGVDALWHAQEIDYDAIILDVNLPPPDGLEICRRLRAQEVWTPILVLTGMSGTGDRVTGLDAGADDYLVKPFAVAELHARLRAITRRGTPRRPTVLTAGDLVIDPAARSVCRQGHPVPLTPREYALVELLVRRQGTVVTRDEILTKLWDFAFEPGSNVVDVTVRRLRQKLDHPFNTSTIAAVRGVGYIFTPAE
jgi:two-component system OmpR family response regulator